MANGIVHEAEHDKQPSMFAQYADLLKLIRDIVFFASLIVGAGWAYWNITAQVSKATETNIMQDIDLSKVKAEANDLKTDVAVLKRDVVTIREDQKKSYESQVETSKDIKELLRRVK